MVLKVLVRTHSGWSTLRALVDSGATLNFISQLRVKELGLPESEHRPPAIHTLDGHKLQTYGVHLPEIRMNGSEGELLNTTVSLVAANMVGYDVILGMP